MGFIDLKAAAVKEIIPGYHGKFVHSENMTLAYWEIEAGQPLPEHAHPHEQVANVIEGTFQLTINGETRQLTSGEAAVIPSGVSHSGLPLTDCRIIDVFHPVRKDYQS